MSSWTVVDWVLACGITLAALTVSAVVGAVVSPFVLRLAERSPDSTTPFCAAADGSASLSVSPSPCR